MAEFGFPAETMNPPLSTYLAVAEAQRKWREMDAQRRSLSEIKHGHEFGWMDRRCFHCRIRDVDYADSKFGINGDETALVCTRLSGKDDPLPVSYFSCHYL